MRNKVLGKKTFLRVSALVMSAVMAVNFNLPNVRAQVSESEVAEYGDTNGDFKKTATVKNLDEIINALNDKDVDHILVADNITIDESTASKKAMCPSAYLLADRNMLIESCEGNCFTITRTGGDLLKSVLEVKGDGSEYNTVNVSIRNLVLDGGAKWDNTIAVEKRGNDRKKSKANSGAAGRAIVGVSYKGTLNLEDGAILQNGDCTSNIRANGDSADSYYYGGAVRIEFTYTSSNKDIEKKIGGGTVNVKVGSKISDCVCQKNGGAIGAYNDAFVNVYGGTICNCFSEWGGAIGCTYRNTSDPKTAAKLCVKGGTFINCFANNGGVFFVQGDTDAAIYGGEFENCKAKNASIIYMEGESKLYIDDGNTFSFNNCSGNGKQLGQNVGATIYTDDDVKVVAPVACTVTFMSENSEYGKLYVLKGESLKDSFPIAPSENDKEFLGWYSDSKMSEKSAFDANTTVNGDMTIYAKWHKHNLSKKVSWDKTSFTMMCDNGDGYECNYYGSHTAIIDAKDVIYDGKQYSNEYYSVQDDIKGYEGFNVGKIYFVKINDSDEINLAESPSDAGNYLVRVNIESAENITYVIEKEFEIKAKTLTDEMLTATNDDDGNAVITMCDGENKLIADKDYTVTVIDKEDNHEITVAGINNYSGTVETKIKIEKKNNGGNDDGNKGGNNGGNDDGNKGGNNGGNDDGNKGGNNGGNDDDEKPGNSDNDDIDPNKNGNGTIVVTFNPNGGSCDVKAIELKKGEQVPELPVAKWDRYVFAGWVNENNELVSDLSLINSNTVLTANWQNITVVAKQKVNVAGAFEKELSAYTEKVQKECIDKGQKFTKGKLKYRYRVLSKKDFKNTVSRNSVSSNKMIPGKAVAKKSGIVTTQKSGTVAVILQCKEKEGKKWVWKNLSENYVFIAIEKPIVLKAHSRIISGVGQTLELNNILMYENSDKVGNLPNFAEYDVESNNKSVVTVDPKTGIITAVGKGKAKLTVTYRVKIGQKKDGSDKFSTIKKKIVVKVK